MTEISENTSFPDARFGKRYRLSRKKTIERLFKEGKSIRSYPYVLYYLPEQLDNPFQLVISAPKRIFRKAHDRNRIRRIVTESVRKQKSGLENRLSENDFQLALFLIYTAREEVATEELMNRTEKLFDKLIASIIPYEKN